jgi:hypothetical protein
VTITKQQEDSGMRGEGDYQCNRMPTYNVRKPHGFAAHTVPQNVETYLNLTLYFNESK